MNSSLDPAAITYYSPLRERLRLEVLAAEHRLVQLSQEMAASWSQGIMDRLQEQSIVPPACLQAHEAGCVRAVHAEANCIAYAARHGISIEGATLYCTHLPCRNCAELIVNSGLARVVYQNDYRIRDGEQLMRESGIDMMQLP